MATLSELERRIDDLAGRLGVIERRLGVTRHAETSREPEAQPTAESAPPSPRVATPAAPPPPVPAQGPAPEAPGSRLADAVRLERLIGGRVYAALGALVIIVGAALGLKLAWDMGWFAAMSDAGKSAAMGAFGLALLAAGELARRRYGRLAGEGLTAAGLGVLYATVYAMAAQFGLLGAAPAVVAIGAVAGGGLWIAARAGYRAAPAVSVAGGFLVPLLVGDPEGSAGVVVTLWLALAAAANVLTAWRGPAFAAARVCAWWGAVLVGGGWAIVNIGEGGARLWWAAGYAGGVWAIMHAAVAWIARRPETQGWSRVSIERFITSAAAVSLWASLLWLAAAYELGRETWVAPALVGAMNLAIAMIASRGRLSRDPGRSDEMLHVALALVAGAMAGWAGFLALGDWRRPLAFTLVGLACVAAGGRARAAWLHGFGFAAMGFGTMFALGALHLREASLGAVGGIALTEWTTIVAACGAAWLAAAVIDRARSHAPIFAGGGLALLLVSLVGKDPDFRWLAGAWGAISVGAALVRRIEPRLRLGVGGLLGLGAATAAWVAGYGVKWDETFTPWALLAHEGLALALALVAAIWWSGRALRREAGGSDERRAAAAAAYAAGAALLLTATSLEAARLAGELLTDQTARRAVVSIWWGTYAVGLLVVGARARSIAVRGAGLALLGIATLKAVVFDLAGVDPAWRVASFLLLGVLLLAVATAYARLSKATGATR